MKPVSEGDVQIYRSGAVGHHIANNSDPKMDAIPNAILHKIKGKLLAIYFFKLLC